jgi:hypothetical protein
MPLVENRAYNIKITQSNNTQKMTAKHVQLLIREDVSAQILAIVIARKTS